MMIINPIISLLLIQSSLAFLEDSYPDTFNSNTYPEDIFDNDNDIEVQRRSNHFLRFGRNNGKYDNNEAGNDDYEDFARPTRSGRTEKNDHFIRFGRGKHQEYLRFGRDPQRRDRTAYLRFGKLTNIKFNLKNQVFFGSIGNGERCVLKILPKSIFFSLQDICHNVTNNLYIQWIIMEP